MVGPLATGYCLIRTDAGYGSWGAVQDMHAAILKDSKVSQVPITVPHLQRHLTPSMVRSMVTLTVVRHGYNVFGSIDVISDIKKRLTVELVSWS